MQSTYKQEEREKTDTFRESSEKEKRKSLEAYY